MPTLTQSIAEARASLSGDAAKLHLFVEGPASGASSLISTENGPIKTLARLAAEAGAVAWGLPSAWATATVFTAAPPVSVTVVDGESYACLVGHTSGVFATDLAAGKWIKIAAKGAAAWALPVPWATITAFVATAPASLVTEDGETYVCAVGHTSGVFATDLAAGKWIKVSARGIQGIQGPTGATAPGRRQTVLGGPLVMSGAAAVPNFLPATSVNRDLTTQNIDGTHALEVAFANGFTTGGALDRFCRSTANLVWSGLTANATLYLYFVGNSDGTLTPGFTALPPLYQDFGVPSTTAGQFTFNRLEMKGYLGNGSSAPQAYVVFVGKAVTNATTVTGTVAYAYNGRYDSGFTATLPASGAVVSRNHNIGVTPENAALIFECTTAQAGFAVGDRVLFGHGSANTVPQELAATVWANGESGGYGGQTSATSAWIAQNPTSGASAGLTAANWKHKVSFDRGW